MTTLARSTRRTSQLGTLLQYWRDARGMSQLALALEANVSPRHVSFIGNANRVLLPDGCGDRGERSRAGPHVGVSGRNDLAVFSKLATSEGYWMGVLESGSDAPCHVR